MRTAILAFVLMGASALPALADFDLDKTKTCLLEAQSKKGNPAICIEEAHAPCLAEPADSPSLAALCFTKARETWSTGITAEMDAIKAGAPEQIAAIAGIELKYDLIASLTQCDRMEELALLGDMPAERLQRDMARCQASSSGLAYARLLWRASTLPVEDK
ncbi:hypothetical protein ACN2XU_06235 [Primorskyibacter sp. 2E107]|uniref:hypothetical protein n=1 Tax=Primorskyibacter sp. 2E107 TaxID=3403458 RepID=UPI003AF742DD